MVTVMPALSRGGCTYQWPTRGTQRGVAWLGVQVRGLRQRWRQPLTPERADPVEVPARDRAPDVPLGVVLLPHPAPGHADAFEGLLHDVLRGVRVAREDVREAQQSAVSAAHEVLERRRRLPVGHDPRTLEPRKGLHQPTGSPVMR